MQINRLIPIAILALGCATIANADNALVLGGGSWDEDVAIRNELAAQGHTVTYDSGSTLPDISGYDQVWDLRLNSNISASDTTTYDTFLRNDGYLYLAGENSSFAARNNSISTFTSTLGGGTITVGGSPNNSQSGNDNYFSASTSVSYVNAATVTSTGGRVLSADGSGNATGKMWIGRAGDLGAAYTGTVVVIADINWTQSYFFSSANDKFLEELIDGIAEGTTSSSISASGTGNSIGTPAASPTVVSTAAGSDIVATSTSNGTTTTTSTDANGATTSTSSSTNGTTSTTSTDTTGTTTTTSSSTNGAATSTTVVTNGATVSTSLVTSGVTVRRIEIIHVVSEDAPKQTDATIQTVDTAVSTIDTTPVTTTVTNTTPVTTTVTNTTPVTTTVTNTTPVTTTVTNTTPVTTTVTNTTPVTTTVTNTTPVTTTTCTTPTTVTTWSDNSTTTSNGAQSCSSSTSNSVSNSSSTSDTVTATTSTTDSVTTTSSTTNVVSSTSSVANTVTTTTSTRNTVATTTSTVDSVQTSVEQVQVTGRIDQLATAQDITHGMVRGLEFAGLNYMKSKPSYDNGMSGSTHTMTLGGTKTNEEGYIIGGGYATLSTSISDPVYNSATATTTVIDLLVGKELESGRLIVGARQAETDYTMTRTIGSWANAGATTETDTSVRVMYRPKVENEMFKPVVGYTNGTRTTAAYTESGSVLTARSVAAVRENYSYATLGGEIDFGVLSVSAMHHTDGITDIGLGINYTTEDEKFEIDFNINRTVTSLGNTDSASLGLTYKF